MPKTPRTRPWPIRPLHKPRQEKSKEATKRLRLEKRAAKAEWRAKKPPFKIRLNIGAEIGSVKEPVPGAPKGSIDFNLATFKGGKLQKVLEGDYLRGGIDPQTKFRVPAMIRADELIDVPAMRRLIKEGKKPQLKAQWRTAKRGALSRKEVRPVMERLSKAFPRATHVFTDRVTGATRGRVQSFSLSKAVKGRKPKPHQPERRSPKPFHEFKDAPTRGEIESRRLERKKTKARFRAGRLRGKVGGMFGAALEVGTALTDTRPRAEKKREFLEGALGVRTRVRQYPRSSGRKF